jgi:hypothetical protein
MIRGAEGWLKAEALWRLGGESAEGLAEICWRRANRLESDM